MSYQTIDPRTGSPLATYEYFTDGELEKAVASTVVGFRDWNSRSLDARREVLAAVASGLRRRADELVTMVAREMGKPVTQGFGEVELSASIFDYYANRGAELLEDEELEVSGGGQAILRTQPIGTILGVMPWNFPLYQVARFVAPNLLLGNAMLLKHASACSGTALLLDEIFIDAGVPRSHFLNIRATSAQIANLIADDRIQGVSLTGSEAAGKQIGSLAGTHLKKCVLELGGSDPFLVLPDADLDKTLTFAENGRFFNGGQACTSSKRMIVDDSLWASFVEKFVERARAWAAGDPLAAETRLGPMASAAGRAEVAAIVDDAVAKGATLHLGGQIPDGPGFYYPVTILSGVTRDMRAYSEEIFGPVALLFRADGVDEAVDIANDSRFGLGAAVFTESPALATAIADALEVGMVGINTTIRSQPSLPFGGVKASGIGRELGRLGLDEFANKKLLRIA